MKAIQHLKTINKHRLEVYKNCRKAGIIWQGITHDLSKYSPIEFFESVKYFNGGKSPIDICKAQNGFSMAWLHHKGRNKHHYEYWQDSFDNGGQPLQMPYKYALELVCDYLAAGRTYMKEDFSYQAEWDWWVNKSNHGIAMHPHTKCFVSNMLAYMRIMDNDDCLKPEFSKKVYAMII